MVSAGSEGCLPFHDDRVFGGIGIKREDIIDGIRAGKLQYKDGNMHGNPWLRLLRYEVEALVIEIFGDKYLDKIKIKNELAQILKEEKSLKRQIVLIEKRKAELLGKLDK